MARKPGFYKKGDWYVTSAGGIQHQKLCRVSEGTKAAGIQLARLMVKQADEPKQIKQNAIPTLAEAHDAFLDVKEVEISHGGYCWYRINLKDLYEMFGTKKVRDVTYEDAVAYKKSLIKRELQPTTINARLEAAKIFFNWVRMPSRRQRYGVIDSPFLEIKLMTATGRERLVTQEEFDAITAKFKRMERAVEGGYQDNVELFTILRHTTMRPGEIRHLRWEYIRFKEHRIIFPDNVIKTRNRREVTMLDIVEDILTARRERLQRHGNNTEEGFVFFTPPKIGKGKRNANIYSGKMISSHVLSERWKETVNACAKDGTVKKLKNGETLVPYSSRHTRITELVMEQHPLPVIMAEAGHLQAKTTMKYVHLAGSQVVDSIRKNEKGKQE